MLPSWPPYFLPTLKTDFKHFLLEKAFSFTKSITSKLRKFCRCNQRCLLLAPPSTSC